MNGRITLASGATFTSTWARCKDHIGRVLDPDEEMCFECKIIQRNLAMVPPFLVKCIENGYNIVEAGKTYEVHWIVLEGREPHNLKIKGYAFKKENGDIAPEVIAAEKFIPVKYLTLGGKDSWLESDD